jgi:glycosyltransferase involved in cell wall biosynthesis
VKVLLVVPEYPPTFGGGIGTYYRELVPALRHHGCEVSVLKGSAFIHGEASYEHDGVTVGVLETARYDKWLAQFGHFTMFPELRRHLAASFALHEQAGEGGGVDVVEVTDWGMLFLPWTISSHAPVLVQMHGSTGQIALQEQVAGREAESVVSMLLERTALAGSTGLASHSEGNTAWWEQTTNRSVTYQAPPLGTDETLVESTQLGKKWLTVGRIQLWKGPQVVCAAWEILAGDAPELEWAGRDTLHGASRQPTSAWLEATFRGTWGRTILPIGHVSSNQVRNRMRAARAVVVPSTWDVFNLGAAEAMALGKVVIVSDGAGVTDLLQHGVNGFVFPNGDAASLAELVRQVGQMSTSELRSIGRAAASTVRERLNPNLIAGEKLALYRQISARKAPSQLWLRDWLAPAAGRAPLEFLDQLPLNDLSRYVGRRTARKVLGKARTA